MRLVFATDRLSARGGADHHLADVIGAAVSAGDRVTVVYGRLENADPPDDRIDRVRARGLAARTAGGAGLKGLADVLPDADVVHIQNVMNPTAIAMAASTGRAVVTVQDHRVFCPGAGKVLPDGTPCDDVMGDAPCAACLSDETYRARTLALTRARLDAARACAAVIVLSRMMAAELAAVGVDAEVVPPWIDLGPPRVVGGDSFVLGGRLVQHKGVIDGWRAWRRAGRPLPLVVAGAGPLGERLHGADRRGWLDRVQLRSDLRRARALLFPARWCEPFGILGVEALAEGTPVIVADRGGTVDWSSAGCLRVPAGDVDAMAAAVERLAAEPDLAVELGGAGREWVGRNLAREVLEPRLRAVYRRVAAG